MTTLTRGVVRNLLLTTKSKTPSSFYNRSISSTSSSTLTATTTTTTAKAAAIPSDVVSDAVPDAADVEEDEEEEVVFSATEKTAAEPTLLQPRVLVYDGVCHLCHGGTLLCFFKVFLLLRLYLFIFNFCSLLCEKPMLGLAYVHLFIKNKNKTV